MKNLDVFLGAMIVLIIVSPLTIGLEFFRLSCGSEPAFVTDYLIVCFEALMAYFLAPHALNGETDDLT